MRISRAVRVALLAVVAIFALSLPSSTEATTLGMNSQRNVATVDAPMVGSSHETRMLGITTKDDVDKDDETPASTPKKKRLSADDEPTKAPKKKMTKSEEIEAEKEKDLREAKEEEKEEKLIEDVIKGAEEEEEKEKEKEKAKKEKAKKEASKEAPKEAKKEAAKEAAKEAPKKAPKEAPKIKKKLTEDTPAPEKKKKSIEDTSAPEKKKKSNSEESKKSEEKLSKKETKKETKVNEDEDDDDYVDDKPKQTEESYAVKEKKIKGNKKDGVIDGSSEGSAEIDKIDLRNNDGWVSVYDDPPLLVIKASLYAFISYNNSEVCDTFNMTLNAVEQKAVEDGRFSYHVVAYVNCTKNKEDETQGRFILNFIPEGKRLLLTECGHREEGEIVNWLRIDNEVPECMTPKERKDFLAQPMKHIHVNDGTNGDVEAVQTDFLTRLEEFDPEEVAIFGAATVAFMAVFVVLIVFIIRKRKVQKDLERTIAGAKAEHAVEDDDLQIEAEEKATKERKGLMDSAKAKSDDPDMEEGSFVNSPAVRV